MRLKKAPLLLGIALITTSLVRADSFSQTYTGSLPDTSAVFQQPFSIASSSQLVITTTSYGGGQNADGTASVSGGFQPSVTLYTAAGTYLASQRAGSPTAAIDPTTSLAADSYLSVPSLGTGSYILTLTNWETQQPPTAVNLSDGFVNFGGAVFLDVSGATRSSTYTLNLTASPTVAEIPEPATVAATFLGFGLILLTAAIRTGRLRMNTSLFY